MGGMALRWFAIASALAVSACVMKTQASSAGPGVAPVPAVATVTVAAPPPPRPIVTLFPEAIADEQRADEARRHGPHKPWNVPDIAKYRDAIEGYVGSVTQGNLTPLNQAAVPFASYLREMHDRIHPYFADGFLDSLHALPKTHPLNDEKLTTRVELALSPDGHIRRMGVIRTSGVTAFDLSALHSIDMAAPFGVTHAAIRSPDGNVYMHWDFSREEMLACSLRQVFPFILRASP